MRKITVNSHTCEINFSNEFRMKIIEFQGNYGALDWIEKVFKTLAYRGGFLIPEVTVTEFINYPDDYKPGITPEQIIRFGTLSSLETYECHLTFDRYWSDFTGIKFQLLQKKGDFLHKVCEFDVRDTWNL